MKTAPRLLFMLMAASLHGAARADETSMFSLSGFGTLGVVKTSTDAGVFKQPHQIRGATTDISTEVDSRLGGQVVAKFNKTFSATTQVLVAQSADGNYRPQVEWAFVKAQVTPDLSLRVGRMVSPFFAVSDFRFVGYANLWVRPPSDVYNQASILSNFDGADVTYQTNVGSATLSGKVLVGSAKSKAAGVPLKVKNLVSFNGTADFDGGISLRFGHLSGRVTVDSAAINRLVAALSATPWASVGQQLSADDKKISFTGLGASYDSGALVLSAELTKRKTDTYAADTSGWFVSAGYRLGQFTPYAIVSKVKVDDPNVVNTIPAGLPAPANALKPAVDAVLASQNIAQSTKAVGVRWDAYRNTAVKFQLDRVKPETVGFFGGGNNFRGATVNVYSMAVDFVF